MIPINEATIVAHCGAMPGIGTGCKCRKIVLVLALWMLLRSEPGARCPHWGGQVASFFGSFFWEG